MVFPEDHVTGYGVDERDEGTSDNWIRRHPELVRLTGRHPFNCEAPLPRLMEHGFITPTSLHYVRNHGHVPKADFDEWTIEVSGLVRRPQKFNMHQIMHEFTPRELPVTLVCAGNRRKEQNMVQQTIGFNWGASGVSTSVWKGARLCDVLKRCGIMSRKRGANYVCFEGQETLPGGGGSPYGTSISVEVAMDERCDLLVAYMQNGKPLEPDHGFPVRMIIPGHIGGRMVKWLKRIVVTTKESGNHYHYKDNRVLPSHVDAETANAEGWWYKPEYIINELNINSAICSPAHGEILPINVTTLQVPYTLKGYAYSGGGRKIIRVEVTIDDGESWRLCKVNHPERPTKHGKYWCWCFWELDIEVMQLIQAKELAVRAWDSSMNTQPQKLTWNVMVCYLHCLINIIAAHRSDLHWSDICSNLSAFLAWQGMMNNCWFRVKVNPCKPKQGGIGLAFEHPTQPGNQSGGWMAPSKVEIKEQQSRPLAFSKSFSSPMLNRAVRQITTAELKRHNTRESPWIVIHNNVYDCTKFLKDHPGGSDSILINAGSDCTEEFDAIHSSKAKAMLEDFKIGEMAYYGTSVSSAESTPDNSMHGPNPSFSVLHALFPISESAPARPVTLNPKLKVSCKLIDKKVLSHDVRLFRFELPSKEHILGLPVGKHIFLSATINGKLCIRAYTPTSSEEDVGYFELLIKIYFKGVHPKFPDGGLMSQHLESLEVGKGCVDIKGPLGHIEYIGSGQYHIDGKPFFMKKCSMLAGGTGITPMYQLIRAILKNPDDKTEVYLVFANRTEEDIMLREELDAWAEKYENFNVWYVVERASEDWKYSVGFITESILKDHLPSGEPDVAAFMCGPPPMIQFACLPNLDKMGYDKSRCYQF
ncbi:hypothetical protein KP509_26G040600 [Ceratopteris richardii]|uniref:Nitrate reductase n=1 Tax=Ceratopteris richardii TaxID=49495 RepID=A0A8T2RMS5_CERRI|nr:hypothetical protein KP509_26G040600 [Ceratopteris richardii]